MFFLHCILRLRTRDVRIKKAKRAKESGYRWSSAQKVGQVKYHESFFKNREREKKKERGVEKMFQETQSGHVVRDMLVRDIVVSNDIFPLTAPKLFVSQCNWMFLKLWQCVALWLVDVSSITSNVLAYTIVSFFISFYFHTEFIYFILFEVNIIYLFHNLFI